MINCNLNCSNVTEPSERVTITAVPGTHCHRALRGKLKFENFLTFLLMGTRMDIHSKERGEFHESTRTYTLCAAGCG